MTNFDQMNGWNLYFLAYFMQNIQKLNMRGPRISNVSVKFIASHFNSQLEEWTLTNPGSNS